MARLGGKEYQPVVSDADGRFATAARAAGRAAMKLLVAADENGRIERMVAPPPCGALLLRLLDASGAPELDATVRLHDLHGAIREASAEITAGAVVELVSRRPAE